MTINELVKSKLESHPSFRERSLRADGLAILALRETGLENRHKENQVISISEMADFAIKYSSLERAWRQILEDDENKHLRGRDYSKGEILSQEKQLALGYVPGELEIKKANSKL